MLLLTCYLSNKLIIINIIIINNTINDTDDNYYYKTNATVSEFKNMQNVFVNILISKECSLNNLSMWDTNRPDQP